MADELKNFKKITYKELVSILILAIAASLVITIFNWQRAGELFLEELVMNAVASLLAAIIIFTIRLWAQKLIAIKKGYILGFAIHKYTLPVSIFLLAFFKGFIPYVSTGDLKITISKRLRLGSFRYGLNYGDLAKIGLAAPISTLILIALIKPIYIATGNGFIHVFAQTAALISISGMLPIKGQEGFDIMYHRRWLFVLSIVFLLFYYLLILTAGVFSYVVALIIAGIAVWIYKEQIE